MFSKIETRVLRRELPAVLASLFFLLIHCSFSAVFVSEPAASGLFCAPYPPLPASCERPPASCRPFPEYGGIPSGTQLNLRSPASPFLGFSGSPNPRFSESPFLGFCDSYSLAWLPDQEVINRILAVVNEEAITLFDLRVAEAFGMYEGIEEESVRTRDQALLQRLIDQKLVVQMMGGENSVQDEELETAVETLVARSGRAEFETALTRFGLIPEDLKTYLREKLLYQKIIDRRFVQAVSVNLEEIESYYRDTYVPEQLFNRLEPQPLTEKLGEIETAIKREKIRDQVVEWLENLRLNADIQIMKE